MFGDSQTDIIVRNVIDTARGLFPEQTAKAEQWINAQLQEYGISYAKYQAQRQLANLSPWLESPITWFVGAFILFKVMK